MTRINCIYLPDNGTAADGFRASYRCMLWRRVGHRYFQAAGLGKAPADILNERIC